MSQAKSPRFGAGPVSKSEECLNMTVGGVPKDTPLLPPNMGSVGGQIDDGGKPGDSGPHLADNRGGNLQAWRGAQAGQTVTVPGRTAVPGELPWIKSPGIQYDGSQEGLPRPAISGRNIGVRGPTALEIGRAGVMSALFVYASQMANLENGANAAMKAL